MYNRGLEYSKLQDAYLFENKVAQPNQQEAFNDYLKILPAVKSLRQSFKTDEIVILNKIIKIE